MKKDDYLKKLSGEIGRLIDSSGLKQKTIEELSGVSQGEISAFKNRAKGITSVYKIHQILDALGYELDIVKKNHLQPS